jgi:hypothetical protein
VLLTVPLRSFSRTCVMFILERDYTANNHFKFTMLSVKITVNVKNRETLPIINIFIQFSLVYIRGKLEFPIQKGKESKK